jgi:iron(III) transport system substrate-binding protein
VQEARDKDGYFYPVRTGVRGLAVNTKAIPLSQAPKSWEDLVDPKWKGKITMAGGEAAPRFTGFIEAAKGEGYLKKLSEQDVSVVEVSARALADTLIAGEAILSPTISRAHLNKAIKNGAPVAWIPMDPVDSFSTQAALAANAPHPNAALLWLDFVLSPEAQAIEVKDGFESLHPDHIKPEDKKLNVVYFDLRDDFLDREGEWLDKSQKSFG